MISRFLSRDRAIAFSMGLPHTDFAWKAVIQWVNLKDPNIEVSIEKVLESEVSFCKP
jgi:hypothetical protein